MAASKGVPSALMSRLGAIKDDSLSLTMAGGGTGSGIRLEIFSGLGSTVAFQLGND